MKIFLVPKNPLGMREEELEPLIEQLTGDEPDLQSEYVAYEQRGYGVTYWEALTIYIAVKAADAAIDATVGKVVGSIIEKGKDWIRRRGDLKESHRPFALTVRDGEGNLLAAINTDRDGNAEDAWKLRAPVERPIFHVLPDDTQ